VRADTADLAAEQSRDDRADERRECDGEKDCRVQSHAFCSSFPAKAGIQLLPGYCIEELDPGFRRDDGS
jgi:hypothetical protein